MKYSTGLISIVLAACQVPSTELTQLSSTINASGNFAATWSETSEGATTGFVYRLHVHNANSQAPLNKSSEVIRTSSIVDTEIDWKSDEILHITCLRGDVYLWINRSVIDSRNIRIELDSHCPEIVRDQWTYIALGTEQNKIPEISQNDPRVKKLLRKEITTSGMRILHNNEETKEVIEVNQR